MKIKQLASPVLFQLTLLILLGAVLRAVIISTKSNITHDEGISYLAASGNWEAYQAVLDNQTSPFGDWVPASQWKAFLQPQDNLAFAQIGRDLAVLDVHPPLYFWLLHLAMKMVGVHFWTGPLLNSLIFVFGAMALFLLAHTLLQTKKEALLVTLIWIMSPARIATVFVARQYELLGFCTILFVLFLINYLRESSGHRWFKWALLAVATTAGALTHFHFALVVSGAGLVFVLPYWRKAGWRFVGAGTAVITGYLLFFLLHPHFLDSVLLLSNRQQSAAKLYWTGIDFMRRIFATADTFTRFLVYGGLLQVALFCLVLSGIIILIWKFLKDRKAFIQTFKAHDQRGYEAIYMSIWLSAITILLYLSLISPLNAMTPKHMSAIWPFLAFAPVILLRFLPQRSEPTAQWVLAGIICLSGVASVYFGYVQKQADAPMIVEANAYLLIDNVHEGILPQAIVHIPDETLVYAADQAYLIEHLNSWASEMEAPAFYLSDLSYTSSQFGQEQIIEQLAASESRSVVQSDKQYTLGMLFVIQPK